MFLLTFCQMIQHKHAQLFKITQKDLQGGPGIVLNTANTVVIEMCH